MRVAVGVILFLGACNQVFGLDEPRVGLLALTPSRGELEPPFDPDVHDYTVALSPLASTATVAAVATGDATVTIDPPDPAALVPGEPRTVSVEASDNGETSTYTVSFTRGARAPEIEKLVAPMPMRGVGFGRGLAMQGDRLVVGAPEEPTGAPAEECDGNGATPPLPPRGAIYIYERTAAGYQLEQRIQAPPVARCSAFGEVLALEGDTLVVGSYRELRQIAYYNAGTAYVYRRTAPGNWTLVRELQPPTSYLSQFFGIDVAISADAGRVVVGAHAEANNGQVNAGALYVYSADDDFLTPRRVARPGAANDYFGYSVETDGDGIIATSFGDDTGAMDSGAIVPIDAALVPGPLIKAPQPLVTEYLGQTLKLRGDTMIVGTPSADGLLGATYVFRRDGGPWTAAVRLARANAAASDRVAIRLAMSGDLIVAGACLGAATLGGWNPEDSIGSIPESGFALVYRDGGADAVQLLGVAASLSPEAGARFSCDVVADGDRIAAGAALEDVADAADAGAVYLFR